MFTVLLCSALLCSALLCSALPCPALRHTAWHSTVPPQPRCCSYKRAAPPRWPSPDHPPPVPPCSPALPAVAWIASVGCTPQFEATQCEERTLVEPVKTVVEELPARTGTDEPTRAG